MTQPLFFFGNYPLSRSLYASLNPLIKVQLEALAVDSTVLHKKFGKGTDVKINKNEKFIHIKFTLGEKKFIFPDAFLMGFLKTE